MSHSNWPNAVAHRIGLGGAINFTSTRVGQTLHIPCARGHKVDFSITGSMPPDFVAKKMMQKGWTIGSKLLCPKHSKRSKTAAPEPTPETIPEPIAQEETMPEPQNNAATKAGRAKRLAYMALDDYYDEGNKRYKPGHSDASIAKDLDLAENAIKLIREESYGPLGVPQELEDFGEALRVARQSLTETVAEIRNDIHKLELRLETLTRKYG